jgi:hypothetical protein
MRFIFNIKIITKMNVKTIYKKKLLIIFSFINLIIENIYLIFKDKILLNFCHIL